MKKPGNQKAPTSPNPSPGRLVVDACCELLRTLQRADVLQEDTGHAMRLQRLLSKAFVKYLFGRGRRTQIWCMLALSRPDAALVVLGKVSWNFRVKACLVL